MQSSKILININKPILNIFYYVIVLLTVIQLYFFRFLINAGSQQGILPMHERFDENKNKYYRLINETDNLPPVPYIFEKILESINNPKSTASDLQKLILQDQALTAKILGLANSAYFAFPRRVDNITLAIVMLGFQTVMEVAFGVSMLSSMKESHHSKYLNFNAFWKYSIACAEASKLIANRIDYGQTEKAYILGLLHDLGRMIFLQLFTNEYDEILMHCRAEKCSLRAAEMSKFGFDHQTAGKILATRWNLPDEITAGIAHHHDIDYDEEEYCDESSIAYLGEYVVKSFKIGDSGENLQEEIPESTKRYLKTKKINSAMLIDDFKSQYEKLEVIFASIL